ncbi:MAG TPA: ROK family transcriptional regulator [Rugosimonospora sp.]|nr:ROK family transcriptional regulator [Rugosimonospora sp.]
MERRCLLPEDVRAHNRGLLLRLVKEQGPLSRRELARYTGLSIPTVATIVTELLSRGYVVESATAARSNLRGPRASQVALVHGAATVLGVDIGVERVQLGVSDLSGHVPEVVEVSLAGAGTDGEALDAVIAAARPLVERAGSRMCGIGVGFPGPVDQAGRSSVSSLPLGWRDVAIADAFEAAFNVPAMVEYNVRAMALAEAYHGLGRQAENLLYVQVGDGVGFSFVVSGVPFRQGAHGVSELGHYQVTQDGPRCVCGSIGCLEVRLAEPYLRHRLRHLARTCPALGHALRRGLSPLDALDVAVHAGEAHAEAVLDDFVEHLSTAIALNANVFSPTRVALGGILADAPKAVITRLATATYARICLVLRDTVQIEPSTLGPYAGVLGAATYALDHLIYRGSPGLPN